MRIFHTEKFIQQYITRRNESLFARDIRDNYHKLSERIKGKSALIIGGAGTIGSSFIKAILRFQPAKLIVIDINENGLTELVRDVRSTPDTIVPEIFLTYPIDFSSDIFKKIFRHEGPFDIIANFAAHKHVRSEKDQYSIEAMIENNVIRAKALLDLLFTAPPKHFFCVSTDKAANPVNVMGASKKLMEDVIMAYASQINISTARFANVAFSNGSLLFGFMERLQKQQPLSAPSDIRRYFVSPRESGELCMLACILGEPGDIFFPKLNEEEMISFADIAVDLLKAHGFEADRCTTEQEAREKAAAIPGIQYPVYFFESDTSGEKSFEEFFTTQEVLDYTSFSAIGVVKNAERKNLQAIGNVINSIEQLFRQEHLQKQDIIGTLKTVIPGFNHIETGKNLDQRM
ncbi:nucleoside-diphosphate sugar epimerase [Chitinophaga alhagiae]|uniref:Nucleoside-diphosphate sugar epimerase n=2 Tax=Chitinophaga alhagiae TaxID=2203219 RepID=A0ABM6WE77_9BACT|nr:nucleoside-diphosphate sugar epimerase [Chitinophaga alhagiae]